MNPLAPLNQTQHEIIVDLQAQLAKAQAENARLAAQWAVAEAKCKEACGKCVPSGGYDYFDEVCGLLRVTRGQRDQVVKGAGKVLEYYAALKAENARLAEESADAKLHAQQSYTVAAVCLAELRRAFKDHFSGPDCRCRECHNRIKDVLETAEGEATAVMRDLLGPTVELLENVQRWCFDDSASLHNYEIDGDKVTAELARLRAAREGGK